MSKLVKTLIMCAYAFLFVQYLKLSLNPVLEDIDIEYLFRSPKALREREMILKKFKHNFSAYLQMYKRPQRFKTDYKYILKYTTAFLHYGTPLYKNGQAGFIESNCSYINCYVTTQKNLLNDYRDYDAILFDVENSWDGPIIIREYYQKFIFMATESAANYPLCDGFYDHFYNLTWTYKLDSDIRYSYVTILDKKGNFVGPKVNMTWIDPMKPTSLDVKKRLSNKRKAAAWFVSNCNTLSGRQNVTRTIEKALKKYNLTVDIFGWCGRQTCPKDRLEECLMLLQSDYYFYLSFENSLSEDYVTEKILYPLQNYAVPIVYGGANYSRFLPPGSYINARELTATQIAQEMNRVIKNQTAYEDYFRWHNHYKYVKYPPDPDICKLCQVLNEQADKRYVYKYFRQWWNPDFYSVCSKGQGRFLVMKPASFGVLEVEDKIPVRKP